MKNPISIGLLLLLFLTVANLSNAQTVKLEQGQNGGINKPAVSPVNWATGNSNEGNSHFFEGQSIPYTLTISKLRSGYNGVIEIEWDTRSNGKSAIDYVTGFDRICEVVEPVPGFPFGSSAYNYASIPAPGGSTGMPRASFNNLPADERRLAIHGGTFGTISYVVQQSVTGTTAITRLRIPFRATGTLAGNNNTVVIAWGGHIASAADWGEGNSASSINGSPYHTRVVSLNGKSVGSQDRSVQAASTSIDLDGECEIEGPSEVCAGSPATYTVTSGADTYAWSVTGEGQIIEGQGTNTVSVNWTGSGTISVEITSQSACGPVSCSKAVEISVPANLTVEDALVCSNAIGGGTSVIDLNDFANTDLGTLVFKKILQDQSTIEIEDPTNYTATSGDVIQVAATSNGACIGEPKTFSITVADRQTFGVCAPFAGKVYDLIGSELTMLYNLFDPENPIETNEVFYIDGTKVLVEIIFKDKSTLSTLIGLLETQYQFEFSSEEIDIEEFDDDFIIAGFLPIGLLEQINQEVLYIQEIRPAFPPVTNKGVTTTQGDKVMRSDLVKLGYSHFEGDPTINGAGVKIGVLSDSYATRTDGGVNTLATDIANGDLPDELFFLTDLPSRYGKGTDEGRAMIQIIHDVAPGAQLGFRYGVVTAGDFAKGILELAEAGSDIIVDDITYITEPFFKDGRVSRAVNEVTGDGVSYFTSAGNFGSKSFEGVFNPVIDNTVSLPLNGGLWPEGRVHRFANGSNTQSIKVFPGQNGPAVYMIALQWDDPLFSIEQQGSQYDLDIYLKNFQGVPLFGFNRNNEDGDPIEILSFTVSEETTVELLIARECESCSDLASNTDIKFKYVVFRGELDPNDTNGINSSTIIGHANSEGAMTVGAVLYANTSVFNFDPNLVPAGTPPFTVATFSSRGGTVTENEIRNKPDFVGPNGVNTTVDLSAPNLENDEFPNFFGTSAAAPHAAAVAALIKQARVKYYPETNPPGWLGGPGISLPEDIRRVMSSTSQDMHERGIDFKSGSGMVRADRALLTLANPNPEIIELVYDENTDLGEAEFQLIITGRNFNENSEVYIRDDKLPSTFDETTGNLVVTIPPFEGNPDITVVNNPISDSQTDGGTAGPVFFFDVVKKTVAIKLDNQNKKFGQVLSPLTFSIVELAPDNSWVPSALTLGEIGLTTNPNDPNPGLRLLNVSSTIFDLGGELAEVGSYIIRASHPRTGFAFSDFFNYGGTLTDGLIQYPSATYRVDPLAITIQPKDLSITFGESISDNLEFEVIIPAEFIQEGEKVLITDVQLIKDKVIEQYLADLGLAKQPGDNSLPLGIFNGRTIISQESLANKSFMVSARTMINARSIINAKTIINSAFDVPAEAFADYLDDEEDQVVKPVSINGRTMINARTILNARTIVNGRTILNGRSILNARTILNGRTIINARTILNSIENGEEATENNSLVVFGEKDLELAEEGEDAILGKFYDFGAEINGEDDDFNLEFFSINMVTGSDVGNHFIIPGTFDSRNFRTSYLPGQLEITRAALSVTTAANPSAITFGDTNPIFTSQFDGFVYSTKFLDPQGEEVILDDNEESVVETVVYKLNSGAVDFPSTGTIAAGSYLVKPEITLIEPSNYSIGSVSMGSLSVGKATPTVQITGGIFEFDGDPKPATATVFGVGGVSDLLNSSLLTIQYEGTNGTSYGPTLTPPTLPGNYRAIAHFAGDDNYNTANSGYTALTIIGCVNAAPEIGNFATAKGAGSSARTATVQKPANTQIGDLLVVGLMFEKGQSPSVTTPDNSWKLIRRVNQSNQVAMVTYYKVITSNSEPASYSFSISQSPKWNIGIARITGADILHPQGPIEASIGASGTRSVDTSIPSINTSVCNSMVVTFFTNKTAATWTPPSGFTEVYDDPNIQQGLTSNMMAYFVKSDPGATGNMTAQASISENWAAQAIVIRPKAVQIGTQNARVTETASQGDTSSTEKAESMEARIEMPSGKLIAYPNPVIDRLRIQLGGLVTEFSPLRDMTVVDAVGRTHSVVSTWYEQDGSLELDFTRLTDGLYVVTLRTDLGLQTVKVIKKSR